MTKYEQDVLLYAALEKQHRKIISSKKYAKKLLVDFGLWEFLVPVDREEGLTEEKIKKKRKN